MDNHMYPEPSIELHRQRKELAPATAAAFKAFSDSVFADGALSAKTKDLIAGWMVVDVDNHERAIELAGELSAAPGAAWKRSGSRRRCAPGEPMHTRTWRSTR